MSTEFIKSATKSSLLALTKKSELTPKFWARLLEALVTKDELQNYVDSFESGGGVDHGTTSGLSDDDHSQYLLASSATSRANFASKWTDLTDGGETNIHIHDGRYFTESEITTTLSGYLPLTAGSTKPLTDYLYIDAAGAGVFMRDGGVATDYSYIRDSGISCEIVKLAQSGAVVVSISPKTNDGSSGTSVKFFLETNTSGSKQTIWHYGNGSGSIQHNIVDDVASFGDVSSGNYVQARPEGVYLVGTTTMWDDLRFPAINAKAGGVNDPSWGQFKDNGSGSTGVFLQWFDKNTEQELFFVAQMPHSWAEGTDIEAHVHWTPAATAAGAGTDVSWGLEYTWSNVNGTYGNTAIIYGDEQTNGATETLTADKHYLTELGTISGSGKTMSSVLVCRVFRDAGGTGGTDDYDDDAGLIEVDFHYQINSFGSKDEYVKGP